jgi:hypothetical protein
MMRTRTFKCVSQSARTNPVGPAPTISTSVWLCCSSLIATSEQEDTEQQTSRHAHQPENDVPNRAIFPVAEGRLARGIRLDVTVKKGVELLHGFPLSFEDIRVHVLTLPAAANSNGCAEPTINLSVLALAMVVVAIVPIVAVVARRTVMLVGGRVQ